MDNQILIYGVLNKFRQNRKKIFKGHMVRRRMFYNKDESDFLMHYVTKFLLNFPSDMLKTLSDIAVLLEENGECILHLYRKTPQTRA